MSCSAHTCKHCQHPTTQFNGPIPFGPDFAFALLWLCPACSARNVELHELGPARPRAGACLECDGELDPAGRCRACGQIQAELVAEVHAACGAPPELETLRALQDEGRYRLALSAIHLRLQRDPQDLEALLAKAKLLTEVHRPAQAIPLLRHILAEGGDADPGVAVDLGVALANSGANEEAIAVYETFLTHHPGHEARGVVLSNIGACYSALGQVAQGEAYHRRAIAADPTRVGSRWNLFANLCKGGRLAEAIEVLEEAAALPFIGALERETIHAFRGQLLLQLGLLEGALEAFDMSLASDPTQPDRQFTRATVLVALGRLEQARVALHHVLARNPGAEAARELLAKISRLGDRPN